ncbi:MAG: ferredoxin [Treponema sp.]|nr:ferredoxin [Treponema sp.]
MTIHAVFFSPTGNTEHVAAYTAHRLAQVIEKNEDMSGCAPVLTDNFTTPQKRYVARYYAVRDIVVFGVPVYAGRVPNKILPQLKTLFYGNGTKAVVLVTFGNRSYGSALDELAALLSVQGFCVIGKLAVGVGHAFANIGAGRPDREDFSVINTFCDNVQRKLMAGCGHKQLVNEPVAPYYIPLREDGNKASFLKAKPLTTCSCTACMICAAHCPMGAISKDDPKAVPGTCIKCHSCIVRCPQHAKYFADEDFLSHKAMLEKNCLTRIESAFFV